LEVYNGDPPAVGDTVKVPTDLLSRVIKVADLIEAHLFISEYGIGRHALSVAQGLWSKTYTFIDTVSADNKTQSEAMERVWQGLINA
jgi:hypothetical protein